MQHHVCPTPCLAPQQGEQPPGIRLIPLGKIDRDSVLWIDPRAFAAALATAMKARG
jgi:hypothetical protein